MLPRRFALPSLTLRSLSALLIVALLANTLAPAALAQDGANGGDGGSGGSIYLPLVNNGEGSGDNGGGDGGPITGLQVFRTDIEVQTPAQWRTLARIAPVILLSGDNWAQVLVDDEQLADLARLRFNPDATNALTTLQRAASESEAPLPDAVAALAGQVRAAAEINAADAAGLAATRSSLRAQMRALSAADLAAVAAAVTVDTDGDGLTNDQETYWCTDASKQDSDFDGTTDGAEVALLKDWMNHRLAGPPIGTAQPFNGWPFNATTCVDNDSDSIPNLAERWEIGTNMNIESTDRDRYDDGQELYGTTYCPGSGNACGYGQLPSANHDGILLFPQMPAWVTAPGNHPLAAAFPKVDINIVAGLDGKTFQMRLATVITTDERHEEGETKSYSTTKTEGTSTSNAETETWENWQETSRTNEATAAMSSASAASSRNSTINIVESNNINTTNVTQSFTEMTVNMAQAAKSAPQVYLATKATQAADFVLDEACKEVQCKKWGGSAVGATVRSVIDIFSGSDNLQNAFLKNNCDLTALDLKNITCRLKSTGTLWKSNFDTRMDAATKAEQEANGAMAGTNYATGGDYVDAQKMYPISYPMPAFVPTITETSGSSRGGARTTTHTSYEEHSVTEGTAKQIGRSWGTATAQNSAHAADLWFAYEVRNGGTDYARQICNLAINVYIGVGASAPAVTYYPAVDFGGNGCLSNFRPGEAHKYTFPSQSRVALTLDQVKAIDLGEPVRIVIEDMSLGQDDYYTDDAVASNMAIAIEDGAEDGDETINTYLIPTWGTETVLNVLARYFPNETDASGMLTAIWTPEYRSDTPGWCQSPRRPTDQPSKVLWCKHALSTAEWWNVYTDGLGDESEGFQNTQAAPGATALFRFNEDKDLDGFSDRTEGRMGTDAGDASSFPNPEMLGGLHNIRAGNQVTSTLSLLNRGMYDGYGIEAVMIAPDDSITITNNTVGGSGRVRALKQVIVGSRVLLPSPLPAPWLQANHAVPAAAGYFTGATDAAYTFTVANCPAGGCQVGAGTWTLNWSGGGQSGSLNFGQGYQSPTFQNVAQGVTLALYSGSVQNGESFTVAANTPRDTFQYTINREPYTPPLVIVSYNDPQGNHRFMLPSQAMSLTLPTDDLRAYAGQMLAGAGVELVTTAPFVAGTNTVQLLVNNPSASTLQNAHLFLEFIDITGTVVSEVPTQVNLPPGPTYTAVSFDSGSFTPPFNGQEDYIVMAFLTDYQGNILDTTGRPLSSFQADPLPELAYDPAALTWNFGTLPQGTLVKRALGLANTGYGALALYLNPAPGLSLARRAEQVGGADVVDYELALRTADLPVGAYDQTVAIKTSDPTQPVVNVHVTGSVTAATEDSEGGTVQRPLDMTVSVPGDHNQGEWYDFTHAFGPDPQSLHPVKVYSQDYATLFGVGKYATNFGQGTASYDMFGDGRDGAMPSSGNLDNNNGFGTGIVNSGIIGSTSIDVTDAYSGWRINPGDAVLIHQTQGMGAGCWELNRAISDFWGNTAEIQLAKPLKCNYSSGGANHAQILRVPQYSTCNVTGTITPYYGWNGSTGGIFAVMCTGGMNISGSINVNGADATFTPGGSGRVEATVGGGFRGGAGTGAATGQAGYAWQGESIVSVGGQATSANSNGGGAAYGNQRPPDEGSYHSGGGGGHGSAGATGIPAVSGRGMSGAGGSTSGTSDLTTMTFGGGGGGGYLGGGGGHSSGANGGGIIYIAASAITVSGAVTVKGGNVVGSIAAPGGAGAGGSIILRVGAANLGAGLVSAANGIATASYGDQRGGNGGTGRVRIEYCNTLLGYTDPVASIEKLNCYITEQTESTPYTSARLNLPETFTGGRTYAVQYGRRLTFTAAGEQVTTLRVPAGLASSTALDLLASGLGGDTPFSLDIGNDGSVDWSGTVANNSTTALDSLAAAFNAYWAAVGGPSSGTLDVPVKVTSGGAGQILLTNLRVANAASRLRHLQLPAKPYTGFKLDLILGDAGALNVSAALDLGADGSIDWRTAAAGPGPARWETGDLSASLNAFLSGKSGLVDVPIRIYVSPSGAAALNGYTSAAAAQTDLQAGGVTVTGAPNPREGDPLQVAATLRNTGAADSGPVTAAFFATAAGWGDWYLGSAFVSNLPAGGAVTPVQIPWDTTGFNGAVPLKVVVNPTHYVTETLFTNNTAQISVTIQPPNPVAVDFSAAPTSGPAPLTVQFTATGTANVTAWLWDFGDNSTSTTQNPSHRYAATGVYTVTLTGSGPEGSDTEVKGSYIAASVPPPPVAAFSATPLSGAAPLTVTFTNGSTGAISTYRWSFGDGGTNAWRVPPPHVYTSAGVYTVTLTVTGPGGADTERIPALITVSSSQVCVDVPLVAGWNLISLPVQPAGTEPAAVLAPIAGKYALAFAYNACDTADPWKRYDPTLPPAANDLTAIDMSRGVWVQMTTAATATFCGALPPATTPLNMCTGWNLLGYPSTLRVAPAQALASANGCYNLVFAYRAADAADPWKRYDPALPPAANDLTLLEPGVGYWVNATQACTWTVAGR